MKIYSTRKKTAVIILTVAAIAMLLACGVASMNMPQPTTGSVKPSDVIGVWTLAVTNSGMGSLNYDIEMEFRTDNTFVQTITSTNPNIAATQTGRWRLSGANVFLENVMVEKYGTPANSPWEIGSKNWWMTDSSAPNPSYGLVGGLTVDPDGYYEFLKVSSGNRTSGQSNQHRRSSNRQMNSDRALIVG